MRNVTVSLDEETARWARLEAARRDTSVSKLVGEMLRREMLSARAYGRAARSYESRGPVKLKSRAGGYPSRDQLHER